VAAHDVQPLVGIETKRRLSQLAIENAVLLIFEHRPEIMTGYLRPTGRPDRFRLEPVELEPWHLGQSKAISASSYPRR
jgi:hypothetical protein